MPLAITYSDSYYSCRAARLMDMSVLRDLEIRHLTALREVARTRNFGRAAERLGFTQSAVSQQIAALERIVGSAVFERPGGPRAVEPTPLGRLLLARAEVVLAELDTASAEVAAFLAGHAGALSIGTFESVSVRLLPDVVGEFRRSRPGVNLRLSENDDQDILLSQLRGGVIDVAFLAGPLDETGLSVHPLLQDVFVLLSPRPGPGSSPADALLDEDLTSIDARVLSGAPLIGQRDSACQRLIEGGLRRAGVETDIVFRTNDNAAVQAMVRAGVGHAVMPALAVDTDDPDVVVRTMSPGIPDRTILVATSSERTSSPAARAFVEVTRQVCTEMPPPRISSEPMLAGSSRDG